jgi:hypothetical protein
MGCSVPLDRDPIERFVGREVRTPRTSVEPKREVRWKTWANFVAGPLSVIVFAAFCSSPGASFSQSGSSG